MTPMSRRVQIAGDGIDLDSVAGASSPAAAAARSRQPPTGAPTGAPAGAGSDGMPDPGPAHHHHHSPHSRASAFRPQPVQTRLRARSIGKAGAVAALGAPGEQSPSHAAESRPSLHAQGRTVSDLTGAGAGAGAGARAQARVAQGGATLSALARQRAEYDARRVTFSDYAPHEDDRARLAGGGGGGTEESSGSTLSDSPPHTPRERNCYDDDEKEEEEEEEEGEEGARGQRRPGSADDEIDEPLYWVEPPSRRGSTNLREEREAWRTGGELGLHLYDPPLPRAADLPTKGLPPGADPWDPAATVSKPFGSVVPAAAPAAAAVSDDASAAVAAAANRSRSKSLEGLTRMSLRRGKSFTSLLVQPAPPPTSPFPLPLTGTAAAAAAEDDDGRDPFLSGAADRAKLSAIAPTPVIAQFDMLPPHVGRPERSPTSSYPPATGLDPLSAAAATTSTLTMAATATTGPEARSLRDFVPQLVILLSLFVSSFVVIALTISTLPGLFLPHSVSDLPELTKTLSAYRASSFAAELHLFVVLTLLFLWKQCFSIPGSILTNILFGALYGTSLGTWWACLWTATGSTGAYLIAVIIAPLVEYYFAKPLDVTRRALKLAPPNPTVSGVSAPGVAPPSDSDLFSHLLLARFFPLLPYSVLNVIAGVLRLPLGPFFTTLLIGSFPFNFATVSIGNLVALAAADPSKPLGDKIWSREVVLKLVAVTLISVVPLAFKDRLRALLSNGETISFALDRARNAVSRAMFGFSAVPHSSITASTASIAAQPAHRTTSSLGAAPSSGSTGSSGSSGGPRAWRRKLSRSIGNAADLLLLGIRGKGFDTAAAAGGRSEYAYERIANGAGESATGILDDAEMGGVDPSRRTRG